MLQPSNDLLIDKEENEIKEYRPLHRRSFPICPKCNQSCSKEDTLVRAFNQVYHYNCFICEDCFIPVADKYYPIDDQQQKYRRKKLLVVCEYHYLKRLGLICKKCDNPIASDQRYHPECIQCPLCVTPTTTHYDYKSQSYCRLHFSQIPETHCAGCEQAILKQFVEHRNLPNQIWHPECYMIFKFWNVKLAPNKKQTDRSNLIDNQIKINHKVTRIWTDLSSFEESSANCISDMLLNVAAGAYMESIRMANQFIMHLEVLFSALDLIHQQLKLHHQELNCHQESNLICKQLIRFLKLLATCTKSDSSTTQELLELITGLAQNLKTLIRIGLLHALNLEREFGIQNGVTQFLDQLLGLEKKRVWIAGRYWFKDNLPATTKREVLTEACHQCNKKIENTDCFQYQPLLLKWHPHCFRCSVCSLKPSASLNESLNNSASVPMFLYSSSNNTLYCQTCYNYLDHIDNDNNINSMRCTHVSFLQQNLQNLKICLTKISLNTANDTNLKEGKDSKSIFEKAISEKSTIIETKRQKSILRILGNRTVPQNQASAGHKIMGRANSIKIGQIEKKTSSLAIKPELKKKKKQTGENNLMMAASPVSELENDSNRPVTQQEYDSPDSSSSPSPVTSFMSPIRERSNKLVRSLRRTFSTHSNNSSGHSDSADSKRRKSSVYYNLFDYQQQKRLIEPRKASLLASTIDKAPHYHSGTSNSIMLPNKSTNIQMATLTFSQDFIVRHAAVISLHRLLSPVYTLDDLIDLIDSKKKKKKIKLNRSTAAVTKDEDADSNAQNRASILWGKLVTHIKVPASSSAKTVSSLSGGINKVFGVPLALVAKRDHDHACLQKKEVGTVGITLCDFTPALNACFSDNAIIPTFVKSCIMVILQSDMTVEGVFRKNGNIRQLKILSESIDNLSEPTPPSTLKSQIEDMLGNQNSIQLAALLKRYLRELPEPLLTFSLYKLFVHCGREMKNGDLNTAEFRNRQLKALHLVCCLLPKPNRDTMFMIFCCLKWISTFSATNKMDISNLARVIAPSVFFENTASLSTSASDDQYARQGAQEEINVIEFLIREIDEISIIPSDLTILTLHDAHQDLTGLNSRYFIIQYQQLLIELEQQEQASNSQSKRESIKDDRNGGGNYHSTSNSKLAQQQPALSLLFKHRFSISKPSFSLRNSNSPSAFPSPSSNKTPPPLPTLKTRRTSWISGLTKK
ncbi:MAG: hypothetical protein EXX96DRAFT_570568 [Benjaminiella poitrasii]|nr:MAG: hypothetical protein EXX96DRAFT_570568 [Benjaminiella poitrasii]